MNKIKNNLSQKFYEIQCILLPQKKFPPQKFSTKTGISEICFLKKDVFENCSLKNTSSYTLLIYSSSESLEETSIYATICLITFFQCIYSLLKKHLRIINFIFFRSRINRDYC